MSFPSVFLKDTLPRNFFLTMPAKGWRKPPGYRGFVRKNTRAQVTTRRVRTAGPHMLSRPSTGEEAAIYGSNGENHLPEGVTPDDVNASESGPQERSDRVSSRLRKRSQPETLPLSGTGLSNSDGSDSDSNETDTSGAVQSSADDDDNVNVNINP